MPQDAFIAINHGRIDIRRKSLDVLLRAWANCGGDELVIIGSGQDHDAFDALLAVSHLRRVQMACRLYDRPAADSSLAFRGRRLRDGVAD